MDLSTLEAHLHGVRLSIYQPGRQILHLGNNGPVIDWHIHTRSTLTRILKRPQLELGRSYVNGEWDVAIRQLPTLVQTLVPQTALSEFVRKRLKLWRLCTGLLHRRRDASLPHWQETNLWLSRICLGDEIFHGCAEYSEAGISMEQAQRIRCRRLISHLQIQTGQHLLDLNAGWGTLPLYLAEHSDVRITALVSTREQLHHAHSEARRRNLEGRVHFRLGNVYQCRGRFDRILASGFLERHPESTFKRLFERLRNLLNGDGLAWLQLTGRCRNDALSNHWYQQQLTVSHSLPLASELSRALEQTKLRTLWMEDQSGYRLQDLRNQAQRFRRNRAAISQRFGETRTRHWEFLLASQIAALQLGPLRQYEFVLGNAYCQWPAAAVDKYLGDHALPVEIVRRIPGLARDL
jgi:cyclopropane-fatty-acyl-phospholipid synthase